MKKVILTTAALAVLSSSTAFATEDTFYGRLQVGGVKLNEKKFTNAGDKKFKSDNDFVIGAAVGYYWMDNLRIDLAFDHIIDPKLKLKGDNFENKVTLRVNSLLLNAFVDLFDASAFKLFTGVGIGAAQIEGKITLQDPDDKSTEVGKANNKTTPVFAVYLGSSAEIAPGINAELTYSFRGFDKTKKFKFPDGTTTNRGYEIKGHFLTAGLRFDF
ncbi:MAG: porin family protein [Rickettsiaceae bacterium]|nr:porin family protein [Rickettsiaceae bacterium]